MNLPLYISHDPRLDWLTALEFGRIDDGQPDERWFWADDQLGFLQDEQGRSVGFKIVRFSEWDPDDHFFYEQPAFWDAPLLGLRNVGVNEIAVAARAHFGDRRGQGRGPEQLRA